ncbi:MAG: DsbA family protein [Alphaproteobacteria bacterium]
MWASRARAMVFPVVLLVAAGCSGADPEPSEDFAAQLMAAGPLEELWLGADTAAVTVIEYASMTCPHCRTFHTTVFDDFKAEMIDTGQVRFLLREFPLDERATAAIMLARCAPGNNGYYALVTHLYETQDEWAFVGTDIFLDSLFAQVEQSGFTRESFESCLANQELFEAVRETFDRGVELEVDATPTFFVNGKRYPGALTLDQLRSAVLEAAAG